MGFKHMHTYQQIALDCFSSSARSAVPHKSSAGAHICVRANHVVRLLCHASAPIVWHTSAMHVIFVSVRAQTYRAENPPKLLRA